MFLDSECLQSGKMFQREFASALKNTALVILTISEETLKRMVLHNAAEVDNVLVEVCDMDYSVNLFLLIMFLITFIVVVHH